MAMDSIAPINIIGSNNVTDSLEELNAIAVLGVGLLQSVLMLGTLLVTYKIPGHKEVEYSVVKLRVISQILLTPV